MCREPIVYGVTTKLRLQFRSRIGESFRIIRCHPSHDVAARCDQGFTILYNAWNRSHVFEHHKHSFLCHPIQISHNIILRLVSTY